MLSSMSPTILVKFGEPLLITGSPGGCSIISTTLLTIIAAVDFGHDAQECVDLPRFHHQWLPDCVVVERGGFSVATMDALKSMGHGLNEADVQGCAALILRNGYWDGGADVLRWADSAAVWE